MLNSFLKEKLWLQLPIKVCKVNGRDVITDFNMKTISYSDVTFKLNDGTFWFYRKPENKILYIHVKSNHPSNIIKHVSKTIEKHLFNFSLMKKFSINRPTTTAWLPQKLKSNPVNTEIHNERNITWFNSPFSKTIFTKIANYFFNLLDNYFPKHHRFNKIFNRNNVKISYSGTKSMKRIAKNHNKNILRTKPSINTPTYNCRNKKTYLLNGQFQIDEVVYEGS